MESEGKTKEVVFENFQVHFRLSQASDSLGHGMNREPKSLAFK